MTINSLVISDPDLLAETLAAIWRLNKKKYRLLRRDDQTFQQWLDLADEYSIQDSRANAAFCLCMARRLGYDPNIKPAEDNVDLEADPKTGQWESLRNISHPLESYDLETRADLGDSDDNR